MLLSASRAQHHDDHILNVVRRSNLSPMEAKSQALGFPGLRTEAVNTSGRSAAELGTAQHSQMAGLPLHGAGISFASLVCIRATRKRTVRRARSV